MPRKPRIDLPGYYHVINRGVNRENIFLCDEDKTEFLKILNKSRYIYRLTIHSFCILDNHYHLLLETSQSNLSLAMRYINSQYAIYFNKKMQRIGPLWQGRFKSRYIQDEKYFWLLLRYIERNPVRARLAEEVGEYKFSSAWAMVQADFGELLSHSLLHQKDIFAWLQPLTEEELTALVHYEKVGQSKKDQRVVYLRQTALDDYFAGVDGLAKRNDAIWRAFCDGHTQGRIARHLGISSVTVSCIVAKERDRCKLFKKIQGKGLLWSYAADLDYDGDKANLLIETVLKYGDICDLREMCKLYGIRTLKQVWEERVKDDLRFKRLNYFLARVLFEMNVEADDFDEVKNVRAEKLRLLAG